MLMASLSLLSSLKYPIAFMVPSPTHQRDGSQIETLKGGETCSNIEEGRGNRIKGKRNTIFWMQRRHYD